MDKKEILISPSLLSADFLNLGKDIEMLNQSEADWIHVDVMDGVFVPNISFGFPVMDAISPLSKKPLDVHMMIVHPEHYISEVARAGAYIMNVHYEACPHLNRTIQEIHAAGMKAGITINPATPVCMLEDIICDVDLVLIMSVNPGFGRQKFIENSLKKIKQLRQMIDECDKDVLIEVDGGINKDTAPRLVQAGADVLVSGSYIFKSSDPAATIKEMKCL